MKNKCRTLFLTLAVVLCMTAFSVTAFAAEAGHYASNENGSETPPDAIESITVDTDTVTLPTGNGGDAIIEWDVDATEIGDVLSGFLSSFSGQPLTPDGNLTLIDDIYQVEKALTRHFRALKIEQRKDDLSQLVDLVVIDIPLTTAFQLVKGPSFHIVIRFLYQRIEQTDDKPILPPEDSIAFQAKLAELIFKIRIRTISVNRSLCCSGQTIKVRTFFRRGKFAGKLIE